MCNAKVLGALGEARNFFLDQVWNSGDMMASEARCEPASEEGGDPPFFGTINPRGSRGRNRIANR